MCNYKSAIVLKNGDIIHFRGLDSHADILSKAGLQDTQDFREPPWVKVEFTPDPLNVEMYRFRLDSDRPEWWSPSLEESVIGRLKMIVQMDIDRPQSWRSFDTLTYSDYIGSFVEMANVRAAEDILKDCPHWRIVHGAYGSRSLEIASDCDCEETKDMLKSLEKYPSLDDDLWSQLEMDAETEAWDNYIKADFLHDLQQHFDIDDFAEIPNDLLGRFYEWAVRSDTSWESEGISRIIDTKQIASAVESKAELREAGFEFPYAFRVMDRMRNVLVGFLDDIDDLPALLADTKTIHLPCTLPDGTNFGGPYLGTFRPEEGLSVEVI